MKLGWENKERSLATGFVLLVIDTYSSKLASGEDQAVFRYDFAVIINIRSMKHVGEECLSYADPIHMC